MKNAFLRYLRANPGLQMRLSGLNRLLGRTKPPAFSGWGMTSESSPPWVSGKTDVDRAFATAAKDLWQQIEEEKFVPSQFLQQPDLEGWMMQLMWRHYFVFWSASFAAGSCVPEKELRLAECGVCDGVTTFFACRAVCHRPHWKFFLYDAWESMRTDQILPSESDLKGSYSYLSVENTQRNLNDFGENLRFIKGYLPESLLDSREHGVIQWLHIDLNSATATESTLEQIYPSIAAGGIVLFDDYGVPGYADTRTAVDRFFSGKKGALLPLPTGQALFFKRG
jgi:hypothetical protein